MKQIKQFLLVVILFTVFANVGWGQIAGWDVSVQSNYGTSPLTASTSASNVTVGGLTRGSGVTAPASGAAARAWGGLGWNYTTAALAITGNAFMTFTIQANTNYLVSLSSFNLAYRRSGTGATSGLLQYKIGAGSYTDIATLLFPITTSGGAWISAPVDLSAIAALQNVTSSNLITFRLVPYGASASAGSFYIYDVANTTANDLIVNGTVAAAITTPSIQAHDISLSSIGQNSMTVNWTNGDGVKRLVIMNTSNTFTNPSDAQADPSANTVYSGSGEQVIYNNTSNTVPVTGLSASTTYWFRVYEYNGTGVTSKYLTSSATNNPNSQITSSAVTPTISIIGSITDFSNVTVNTSSSVQSYSVSGTNLGSNDIVITAPVGFELSLSNSPFASANLITLAQTSGSVSATTIYVRFSPTLVQSYTSNITNISSGSNSPSVAVTGNGTAVPNPASFTAVTASSSQINLTATANANSHNIVVIYNATGTFSTPTDGVAPGIQGDAFAGGTIWYKGTAASLTHHSSLSPFQTVYYKTFSYDALNFYSAGLAANATTLKIAPTTQSSAITFPTVGNTSMTINWTNGDGDRRIVIINTSNSFTDPVDGATITTSTTYSGSGEQCIYNSTSNTVSVTGLTAGTVYWFRVYEYNNTGLNSKFLLTTGTNNPNSQVTNTPASFFENFEAGTKGSYAVSSVVCTMGSWEMSDALIGNLANDKKNNTWSVRMQTAGYIKMNFDLTNGARDITINSASYGTDATCTWQLQKSTDGGLTWSNVGALVTTTATLTPTTFSVNQPGAVRFKILKTTSSTKINIDDITITDYDKTITTSSPLPLTEYGNLTINGSGINVTLAGNTTVNGTLTFTNGKLTLGTNNLTLGSSATVTGSTSSNYIVTNSTGVLTRNSVGGTETLYPIGTVAAYSPVWITNTGISDNISVNVEPDVTGTNNGDDRVKLKWNISEGTLGGSIVTLKIGWMQSQEGTLFSNNRNTYAKLWHLENNNWTLAGNGENVLNTSAEPYTLYSTNITSFSPFGSGLNESAMPVQLFSLNSSATGRNIKLNWTTASEINNSGFDVERSGNRQQTTGNWEKIGYVSGKGTTNNSTNYSFDDRNLQTGKYNYRLKQIDHNGNFEYFSLNGEVEVGVPAKFDLSQNYPNPFNPVTKINFDLPFDSKVNISLYDITGREVKSLVNESRTAGYHTVQFNASDLSSGIYFYRIMTKSSAKDFVMTKKMAVIK